MSTVSHTKNAVTAPDDCPALAPEEHAWIEAQLGRALTNVEAQDALREAKLVGSWAWEHRKQQERTAKGKP